MEGSNTVNTLTYFECEIDNLYYSTIEGEITHYFDMGHPDNSSIPSKLQENTSDTYILICTKSSGKFNISNYALKNGKYMLSVALNGKLHRC